MTEPRVTPHALTRNLAEYYHWEETDRGIRIYIHSGMVDRLQAEVLGGAASGPDGGTEVGGILLGRMEEDRGKAITVIDDFVPVPCSYRGEPLYTLSDEDTVNLEAALLSLSFLKTLVNTPSPVGHEARGQRAWLDYAGQFADETFSDAYGNCVAVLNKGGSPRLMLAGHADEIAMAVNYINDEGFIYVRKMGGVDAAITKAQRVVIHTRNGAVKGVVGNVAPHLMKEEKDAKV